MIAAFKGLFGSKKYYLVLIGSGVVGALQYAHAPSEIIAIVGGLFGVNVLGQGLADFGKGKK